MGLFDFFDEANAQFKKDVGKAWKELWSSDSDSDDDDYDYDEEEEDGKSSSSVFSDLSKIFRPTFPDDPRNGGFTGILSMKQRLENVKEQASAFESLKNGGKHCTKPIAGTPVYCKLAGAVEHTGIYVGNGEIAHLSGDGNIEVVSPEKFCARLDGLNPTRTIYFAQFGGKALGKRTIADRAKRQIGSMRDYNIVFDNCHQFTCGCISGDFENPCNFFWMVEGEITDKLGTFTWEVWDY